MVEQKVLAVRLALNVQIEKTGQEEVRHRKTELEKQKALSGGRGISMKK